jgi:hypothetical protein
VAVVGALAVALLLAATTAGAAQSNYYFVERGHWWVSTAGPGDCRAANRPAEELNAAPFNAVQFFIRPGNALGIDLFLWPGAVVSGERLELRLRFDAKQPMLLPAEAIGDFALRSDAVARSPVLRELADAERLHIGISGRPDIGLLYLVEDGAWLLQALLKCASLLPKQ